MRPLRQVLDATPLLLLSEHTGRSVAERFFNDYVDLLPSRSAAIVAGLEEQDKESTLDALVSLKVTSAMAGATEMEATSRDLEHQVHAGLWADGAAVKAELFRNILRLVGEARRQGQLSR